MKPIMLKRIKFSGIKAIHKQIDVDFTPSKDRENMDNVEFWGLDKYGKYEFGAIKSIFLVGQNGSGKSSVIEAIASLYAFASKPRELYSEMFSAGIGIEKNWTPNYKTRYINSPIEWEADFASKVGDLIYLYKYKVKVRDGAILHEELTFDYTKDGRTISEGNHVFTVKNNILESIAGHKVRKNLSSGNGILTIGHIENREIIKSVFPMHHQSIYNFSINAFTNAFSRERNVNKNIMISDLSKAPTTKIAKQILSLYQVFDSKIKGTKLVMGAPVIDYEIAKGEIIQIGLNDVLNIFSTGSMRMFEIANSIYRAISDPHTTLFIDELDRSLHDSLSEFLTAFIVDHTRSQVFITTHNLDVISNPETGIRRDQIYIISTNNWETKITRGMDIATNNKQNFKREYIKHEFLGFPDENERENLWDQFVEYE